MYLKLVFGSIFFFKIWFLSSSDPITFSTYFPWKERNQTFLHASLGFFRTIWIVFVWMFGACPWDPSTLECRFQSSGQNYLNNCFVIFLIFSRPLSVDKQQLLFLLSPNILITNPSCLFPIFFAELMMASFDCEEPNNAEKLMYDLN